MILFIADLFFGTCFGVALMAVMAVGSQESRLETQNPPFNLETPSRPAQAELEAFWEEQ
jgi:hypothetical protein